MTTAVHKKEKRSQTVSAVWLLFSFSFGFISSTLLLCRQPSDLLPVLREEIAEHAAHSEHKADGKAGLEKSRYEEELAAAGSDYEKLMEMEGRKKETERKIEEKLEEWLLLTES